MLLKKLMTLWKLRGPEKKPGQMNDWLTQIQRPVDSKSSFNRTELRKNEKFFIKYWHNNHVMIDDKRIEEESKDDIGEFLLSICRFGYFELFKILVKHLKQFEYKFEDIISQSPFYPKEKLVHHAAMGLGEQQSLLLCQYVKAELKLDFNIEAGKNHFALYYAAQAGNKELCEWLIKENNAFSALHITRAITWAICQSEPRSLEALDFLIDEFQKIENHCFEDAKRHFQCLLDYKFTETSPPHEILHFALLLRKTKFLNWFSTKCALYAGKDTPFLSYLQNCIPNLLQAEKENQSALAHLRRLVPHPTLLPVFKKACLSQDLDYLTAVWELIKKIEPRERREDIQKDILFQSNSSVLVKMLFKEEDPSRSILTANKSTGYVLVPDYKPLTPPTANIINVLWGWAKDCGIEQYFINPVRTATDLANPHVNPPTTVTKFINNYENAPQGSFSGPLFVLTTLFKTACRLGWNQIAEEIWMLHKNVSAAGTLYRNILLKSNALRKSAACLSVKFRDLVNYPYAPFIAACSGGHTDLITKLLKWGDEKGLHITKNMFIADGYQGLIAACRSGNIDAVQVLWNYGANLGMQQSMLETKEYGLFIGAVSRPLSGDDDQIISMLCNEAKKLGLIKAMLCTSSRTPEVSFFDLARNRDWEGNNFEKYYRGFQIRSKRIWEVTLQKQFKGNSVGSEIGILPSTPRSADHRPDKIESALLEFEKIGDFFVAQKKYAVILHVIKSNYPNKFLKLWACLKENEMEREALTYDDNLIFRVACKYSDPIIVKELIKSAQEKQILPLLLLMDNCQMFRLACSQGRVSVVNALLEAGKQLGIHKTMLLHSRHLGDQGYEGFLLAYYLIPAKRRLRKWWQSAEDFEDFNGFVNVVKTLWLRWLSNEDKHNLIQILGLRHYMLDIVATKHLFDIISPENLLGHMRVLAGPLIKKIMNYTTIDVHTLMDFVKIHIIGMMSFSTQPTKEALDLIRMTKNQGNPILFKVQDKEEDEHWYIYGQKDDGDWNIIKLARSPFQTTGPGFFQNQHGGEDDLKRLNLAHLSENDYEDITLKGSLTLRPNPFKHLVLLDEFKKISTYLSDHMEESLTDYYQLSKENYPAGHPHSVNIKSMMQYAIRTVHINTIESVMRLFQFTDLCETRNILDWTGKMLTRLGKSSKRFKSKMKDYHQFKRDLITVYIRVLCSKGLLSGEEENGIAKKNYDRIIEIFKSIFKVHKNEFLDAARVLIDEREPSYFIANFYFYLLIQMPELIRYNQQKEDLFKQLSNIPLEIYIPKYFLAPICNDDDAIDRWTIEQMIEPAVSLIEWTEKFAGLKNQQYKEIWLNLITMIPLGQLIKHLEPKNALQQDQNDQTNQPGDKFQDDIHQFGEEKTPEAIKNKCTIFLNKYYRLRNSSKKKRTRPVTSYVAGTTAAPSPGTSCAAGPSHPAQKKQKKLVSGANTSDAAGGGLHLFHRDTNAASRNAAEIEQPYNLAYSK